MDKFKKEIIDVLRDATGLKDISLETPPSQELGDYAFPCFILSKSLKQSPNEIAQELCKKIRLSGIILKTEVKGPFLNFFINKNMLNEETLTRIHKLKDKFGLAKQNRKNIMVEFFHANTHKGVHIGHVRNISLGAALSNIMEFAGYNVIRVNYQGDIGPHVAKALWGYMNLKSKEPRKHKGEWLGQLYSKANTISKENKESEAEIKKINNDLYKGDKKILALWKKTRKYCLDDFKEIYKVFGVKYDRFYFESQVEKSAVKIAKELYSKGIACKSEGAIIVNLNRFGLGVYVLLTQDGNAVYHTKDLALAELKVKDFKKIDKSIHVVGKEQELYFRQLFKTFELIGSPLANKSFHLIYELVMLPEGKMSSREGNIVLYIDLVDKLKELARTEVEKRHSDWSKTKRERAIDQIAFGALKFAMLSRENNRILLFDWDKVLDFEGESGPYVQYAYARICSILRKRGGKITDIAKIDYSLLEKDMESELVRLLSDFPSKVEDAAQQYKPHIIARYLLDLAQKFNEYYHKHNILNEKEDIKEARLLLIISVKQVLRNGLNLLGIEAPEQM